MLPPLWQSKTEASQPMTSSSRAYSPAQQSTTWGALKALVFGFGGGEGKENEYRSVRRCCIYCIEPRGWYYAVWLGRLLHVLIVLARLQRRSVLIRSHVPVLLCGFPS
jgi:hypothetical protein